MKSAVKEMSSLAMDLAVYMKSSSSTEIVVIYNFKCKYHTNMLSGISRQHPKYSVMKFLTIL